MNAHEQYAVATGYVFLILTTAMLAGYAEWARRGWRSVKPKQRKEKKP